MSTVAWDGRTLAVDRQRTIGSMKVPADKLQQNEHLVFGFTGSTAEGQNIWRHLSLWSPDENSPHGLTLRGYAVGFACEEDSVHAIVVEKKSGRAFMVVGRHPVFLPIEQDFLAIGSGAEYAMAAMHHGATAEQAVETTIIYDVYTGLGVMVCEVRGVAQDERIAREASFDDASALYQAGLSLTAKKLDEQVKVNVELVERNRSLQGDVARLERYCIGHKDLHVRLWSALRSASPAAAQDLDRRLAEEEENRV